MKADFFAELWEEMGAQYHSLLFYCSSRWLSREKVVIRVYSWREVAEEESQVHAQHFRKEHFVSKLAYLRDI